LTQLREAQTHLVSQERLRALGGMANNIAHDFNNALTPILGLVELLLRHPDLTTDRDKLARYIRQIQHAAQDAARVVQRLHAVYRPRHSGEVLQPVQLNTLISDAVKLTAPSWRQKAQATGVTITVQTDLGEIPAVTGNETELRDAVAGLILHATESLPNGGTVTIRTALDGNRVRVEFGDNGIGMSTEARQHCFEPFYTLDVEHRTSLSLALVYGIIHRHEGNITVESEPGLGSTFTIYLPVSLTQPAPIQADAAELVAGKLRILLVDDEPGVRIVVAELLKIHKHQVVESASGEEALRKLRDGKFDVVISDQTMPGMTGEQLAVEIKRQLPALPVILLTGHGLFMQSEALPAGVDLILNKPTSSTELQQALNRVRHHGTKSGA
ncbi:MAG: response regulator, partial [Verrucomicrobiota bacterium]